MKDVYKKLYEVTDKIAKMDPWEWLYDIDIFAIQPEGYLEPFFVSVMGYEGNCYGISVYYGADGFVDFDALSQEDSNLPVSYLMSDIDCLTCYFGPESELDDESLWKFEEMGIHPFKEDKYFYFLSFEPRFYPSPIDDNEAKVLLDVFKGLYYAIDQWMNEHTIEVKWEEGEICFAYESKNEWSLNPVQRPFLTREYPRFILDDEYTNKLKKCQRSKESLSLELMYVNAPVLSKEENTDKPINPLMFLVLDNDTGEFVQTAFLDLDDDEIDYVLDWITDYIEEFGIPGELRFHNPYIEAAVDDLSHKLDIEITYDDLDGLSEFFNRIIEESI